VPIAGIEEGGGAEFPHGGWYRDSQRGRPDVVRTAPRREHRERRPASRSDPRASRSRRLHPAAGLHPESAPRPARREDANGGRTL